MDETQSEGPEPSSEGDPDPMREAGAPGMGEEALRGVPAPPGVTMVAPPGGPRNASSAKSEGRAAQGHYRGRSPKAPAPPC
jgi:hypothetical protein